MFAVCSRWVLLGILTFSLQLCHTWWNTSNCNTVNDVCRLQLACLLPIVLKLRISCEAALLIPRLHDTTGCSTTGLANRLYRVNKHPTGCQTGLDVWLHDTGCIQPVECFYTRHNRLSIRIDNRLYRVNGTLMIDTERVIRCCNWTAHARRQHHDVVGDFNVGRPRISVQLHRVVTKKSGFV